jgi:hypothetical protein
MRRVPSPCARGGDRSPPAPSRPAIRRGRCWPVEQGSAHQDMAYKSIDAVMEAQKDLVEVVHTLHQVVGVKG